MMRPLFFSCILVFLSTFVVASDVQTNEPDGKQKRPKVGLVLSGGGAKGFAYIGLFRVLEEVGLPIDYVGGTSIGSIMAGLYSVGYSADEIERVVREQNWDMVLRDEIERKYIAYEERDLWEKSIVSLPLNKRKIGLNSSLYYGQEVNLILNRFFSPVWDVTDFSKLPTPFLCIGTNIFTGEAVELTSGYLPMAVRASMSIPGYFSATHYQGKYLVDGGVVNNYPAADVKKMGAQFLIGGDVQSPLKNSMEELSSVTVIIDQIVSFHRQHANMEAKKLINLDILFSVSEGMMDFMKYDSIIAQGERVARSYYPQLKRLADSLNAIEYRATKVMDAKPLETIEVAEVKYEGNNKMSTIYLDNYFEAFEGTTVEFDEIEEKVTSLYGTGFFNYVFYELEKADDGRANLIIKLQEGAPGYLSAAIHYDSDYQGSIMLAGVFRNVLGDRSKLFTELILGTNPRLKAFYTISNGLKPSFGSELEWYSFSFNIYNGQKKYANLHFTALNVSTFLTQNRGNMLNWRFGLKYELFRIKQDVQIDPDLDSMAGFNPYGSAFVSLQIDTRDKPYFSTNGLLLNARVAYVVPLDDNWTRELFTNALVFYVKYQQSIRMSDRFVFRPGLFAGGTLRDESPPLQHWFGAGGLNEINYVDNLVPFSGLHFVQRYGYYAAIARLRLQYNPFGKLYFTLLADAGNLNDDVEKVFFIKDVVVGYGGTLSYNSFIGPVELSVMGSNLNQGVMLFLNIGFAF